MVMFMLVSAFAKPQEEPVEDPNDPKVIENALRQTCSLVKSVGEASLLMNDTTDRARELIKTLLPVTSAGLAAYPAAMSQRYHERLSRDDQQLIMVRVGQINDHMLSAWSALDDQIKVSQATSVQLLEQPPRRLRRADRETVVETCTQDRLQIILAIATVGEAAAQMKADLDALEDEIATRVAVRQ